MNQYSNTRLLVLGIVLSLAVAILVFKSPVQSSASAPPFGAELEPPDHQSALHDAAAVIDSKPAAIPVTPQANTKTPELETAAPVEQPQGATLSEKPVPPMPEPVEPVKNTPQENIQTRADTVEVPGSKEDGIPYHKLLPDRSQDDEYLRPIADQGNAQAQLLYGSRMQAAIFDQLEYGYAALSDSERESLESMYREAEYYLLQSITSGNYEAISPLSTLYLFDYGDNSEMFRPNEALAWSILGAKLSRDNESFFRDLLNLSKKDGTPQYTQDDFRSAVEIAIAFAGVYEVEYYGSLESIAYSQD